MNTPNKKTGDETLRAQRALLQKRAEELRDRLRRVQADLGRELDPLPKDFADAAVRMENDEVLRAVEESARGELRHIDAALARIEVGRYGICEHCGASIAPGRLAAIPYATDCARCAQ